MADETIAAIATATGFGAIGIVKVSGSKVKNIIKKLFNDTLEPRIARLLPIKDKKKIIDKTIVIFYPAPKSYTGEDVLEIQAHGGMVVLEQILKVMTSSGASLAKPGEFTLRAFLNNKIDLLQAESIMDLIYAKSTKAAQAASSSLQGEFSSSIKQLLCHLNELRVHIEASIDFSDEDIDFYNDTNIKNSFTKITDIFTKILRDSKQGEILKNGITIAFAGKPNSGKSSLLNALTQQDSAIISTIAGTTRDVLTKTILIDDMPVHLVDTAGIRASYDEIEKIGIKKAFMEYKKADRIMLLVDGSLSDKQQTITSLKKELPNDIPIDIIINKIDLTKQKAQIKKDKIFISAKKKDGIELLKKYLKEKAGYTKTEDAVIARTRHINHIKRSYKLFQKAKSNYYKNQLIELVADDLYHSYEELSNITGKKTSDELLGDIFSSFCIGK
jgi:tRNA modification GTPase